MRGGAPCQRTVAKRTPRARSRTRRARPRIRRARSRAAENPVLSPRIRSYAAAMTERPEDGTATDDEYTAADRATVLRLAREEAARWAELIDRLR
ncbi:hypothetical protein GA0115246_109653 [Streptomyces sp. SolWspMP-sol7th]|nr:hypothetical protein GA0115246_109653 [Streptomyces sp. SolWspMP-sol7th]